MMKRSTVALVCILVMVMVVVEPTIVRGKVEEKSHLEAAKEATSQSFQNAVDKAGEAGEKIQYHTGKAAEAAKDTVTAAGVKASEATEATKDTLLTTGQKMQESVGKVYDTTTGALGSAGETFSNSVGSAKDTVFGVAQKQQEEPEGGVYDRAAQYYDIATQKTAEAAQAMKAAAAQTAQHVQGNAYQAADTSRNTLHDTGSTIYDSLAMAGEKLSQAAEAARDSTLKAGQSAMWGSQNVHNPPGGTYYEGAKDTVGEYYRSMTEKLGSIAEVMGWQPVPDAQMKKRDRSKLSPYSVFIGNKMYELPQKQQQQDGYLNRAFNSMEEAARSVREKTLGSGAVSEEKQSGTSPHGSWSWPSESSHEDGAPHSMRDKLGATADYTTGTISGASQSMKDAAHQIGDYTTGTISGASENMKDAAQKMGDYTTGTISGASESMKDTAQKMGETWESAGNYAAEKVGDVTENLKKNTVG
ncbi:unnamed protein product [Sphagnum jensenii]|uniref:Uncharacterized protein n=1 Tax=Sphagnum jensenii TaxID=128206 RepID=A0ABP1AA10_9BRYO